MRTRFTFALAALAAMTFAAHATSWYDAGGAGTVNSVFHWLNGSNVAVPASSSNPLPVSASGSSSPNVGAGAIATGQYSNATASATQIVAARTGAAGTGRVSVTLYNSGAVNVFVGASGVTTSTGIRILPGGSYTIYTTAAVYGVPASGTGTLDYLETY